MSSLIIEISNSSRLKPTIFIDNKPISLKKQRNISIKNMDDSKKIHLKIENYHPIAGKTGILICYLFFLISGFGIFDYHYKNKYNMIRVDMNLYCKKDSYLKIKYLNFKTDTKAIDFETNADLEVFDNLYFQDEKIKKKLQILKYLKLFTWILVILGIVFGIYKSII